jgi:phosphatidylglycerophosphate synthase
VLLFATDALADGSPVALVSTGEGETVLGALVERLRSLDATDITVVTRPAWVDDLRGAGFAVRESADVAGDLQVISALAASAPGSVVLGAADIVAHRSALAQIAAVRVRKTVAAVTIARDVPIQPIMRQRDQVISVGTQFHEVTGPNAGFLGLLAVGPRDRDSLIAACAALRNDATLGPDLDGVSGGYGAVGLVLLAVVRSGVRVSAYSVRHLRCARLDVTPQTTLEAASQTAKNATAALAEVDEPRAALQAGLKEDEEFLATYVVQSYTPRIVAWFARHGITPNGVTWISILIGVAAAGAFATGDRIGYVIGAVLLYFSFVFDCCDGQLARFTGNFSPYGGWLDMIADRAKEYIVFVGLAIGGVRAGQSGVWALALAAIVLQTVRHMIDTWYGALQETATRSLPAVPLDSPIDTLALRAGKTARSASLGATLGRLSASAHGRYRSPAYYLKRSVVLPIGDRWMLMAVTAAIFGPKITFIVLLVAASLAFAYVFAGRTLRALAMRVVVVPRFRRGTDNSAVTEQRDDGPIARAIGVLAHGHVPPVIITLPAIAANLVALGFAVFGDLPTHRTAIVIVLAALMLAGGLGASARADGPLDWLFSAALRAAEYTFIVAAGVYGDVPLPLIYSLLGVLVLIQYDTASRIEKAATPFVGARAALGWDGRTVVLAAFVALGWATAGFAIVTGLLAIVLIAGTAIGYTRTARA